MAWRSWVYLLMAAVISPATLCGQEAVTFNLRGVTVGVTSQAELEANERWGEKLTETTQPDGSRWLAYRFWVWQRVIAVVQNDVVQLIDAVPPDRLPAEKLAEAFELGQLIPVESADAVPPAASIGPPVEDNWQTFSCSDAAGVLIYAEAIGDKRYARRMRLYSSVPPPKAYIGLRIHPVTPVEASQAGLKEQTGIYVDEVTPESPSDEAGVKAGDVILTLAGEQANKSEEFVDIIHKKPVGTSQPLVVFRDGRILNLTVTLRPRPEHLAFFQRGYQLMREGQIKRAVDMFSKAIGLDSSVAVYFQQRADCLRQMELGKEALKDANEAIRLDDKMLSGYLERAHCYLATQQYQEALSDCQHVIDKDGTIARAYSLRGQVFAQTNEIDKAFTDFDKAVQVDPQNAAGYSARGSLCFHQQQYDKAIQDFSTAIGIEPQVLDPYILRGWCYIRKADYPAAIASFEKGITTLPSHDRLFAAYHGLGTACLYQHSYQEALVAFTEAINRNRDFLPSYEGRAKAYEELGDSDKAAADLKIAGKMEPQPQPQPPPPASSSPGRPVPVLFDGFDGRSSAGGKPAFSSKYMEWKTDDGAATLTAKVPGVLPVMYSKYKLKDFVAEVEVIPPATKCSYGIVFRSDDPTGGMDHYYLLSISDNTTVRLSCWQQKKWMPPQELPLQADVLSLEAPNRLRVEVNDQRFLVLINGKQIGEFVDARLEQPGVLGFGVVSMGKNPVTVKFRSFHVFRRQTAGDQAPSGVRNKSPAPSSPVPPPAPTPD